MKKIKLLVELRYGKEDHEFYKSGAILSAANFPEEVFKQNPERSMAELVGKGQAVDLSADEEPPAPPAKTAGTAKK